MGPYGQKIMEQLHIDTNIESLIAGSVSIGGLLSCLLSGKLADKIGRKLAISFSFILISVGWFIVTCSINFGMVLSGRILHGFGEGMVVSTLFIWEKLWRNTLEEEHLLAYQ